MWLKTTVAFLWGMVISASIALNISKLQVFPVDVSLLLGLLLGFLIWGLVITYSLSKDNVKQASLFCTKVFVPSVVLNISLSFL